MMKNTPANFDLIRELAFNLPATTLAQIVADLSDNKSSSTIRVACGLMAKQGASTAGEYEFVGMVEKALDARS